MSPPPASPPAPGPAFNEGKCCDAAIRTLETRFGQARTDLRSPEKEGAGAPVELTCRIGGHFFALEHTSLEPFSGFAQLQAEAPRDVETLRARLEGALPPFDYFELHLPAGAIQALPRGDRSRVLAALGDWIEQKAPTLRRMPMFKIDRANRDETPAGVPFKVRLHRHERLPGHPRIFDFKHLALADTLELDRQARLRRACAKKYPKLAWWKQHAGARTVLVLEDNDMQLSNETLIYEALAAVEGEFLDPPDEIHLVTTFDDRSWHLHLLRVDDVRYYQLCEANLCRVEFDPTALRDVVAEVSKPRC